MPKIKIIIADGYYDYDDHWCNRMAEGISDWEDVSDEDYQFISSNIHHLKLKTGGAPVIIQQDSVRVVDRINDIKKTIKKLQDDYNRKIEGEKRKREEVAEKRRMKKIEKDKAALERLIKENPAFIEKLKETI